MWLKFCYPGLLAMTPQYMFNVFKKNKREKNITTVRDLIL